MNRLPVEDRALLLGALAEGHGIQTTCRLTSASKNTVLKLVADVGAACTSYVKQHMRALPCRRVRCESAAIPGQFFSYSAMDMDTQLVFWWGVGDHLHPGTSTLMAKLASRVSGRALVRTTSLQGLPDVIDGSATLITDDEHLVPALEATSADPGANAAARSLGSNAKMLKHLHAISLHFMVHNFARLHPALGRSPAMAAGLAPALWTMKDLIDMTDMPCTRAKPPQTPA